MNERTIVNYDELHQIAKLFDSEGEAIAQREAILRQRANQLEAEWVGEGADKFFNEFYQEVLPGLRRLQEACQLTFHTLVTVMKIFNDAEEETANYFKDGSLEDTGGTRHGIDVSGLEFGMEGVDPGEAPGGMPTSGIDVEDLDFKVETGGKFFTPGEGGMPPTGEGEGDFAKIETGEKPVPATQEVGDFKVEMPMQSETAGGGSAGGGGGSSAGSQGIQGGLEMGVGSHSQTSSGPGVSGVGGGGSESAPQHVYQDPAGSGVSGAAPQSAPSTSAGPTGGPAPVRQSGVGEAAGAAGALGGAGAAAAAAGKKIKENKEGD